MHPVVGSFVPDDTQLGECSDDSVLPAGLREHRLSTRARRRRWRSSTTSMATARIPRVTGSSTPSAPLLSRDSTATSRGRSPRATPMCWSGYYHGVLERSLVRREVQAAGAHSAAVARHDVREIVERMTPLDRLRLPPRARSRTDDRDGPEPPDLARGLLAPRAVGGTATRAAGGVFMENISSSYGVRSLWLTRRRSALSVQLGRARGQATLLPDRDVAHPPVASTTTGSARPRSAPRSKRRSSDCASSRSGRDASSSERSRLRSDDRDALRDRASVRAAKATASARPR